jgi:hypothetical protein
MKKLLLSALAASYSLWSIAQPIIGSNLTIFSEDGNKFFLILNGERQNLEAQTNIRVEDLTQAYYNAKIHFCRSVVRGANQKCIDGARCRQHATGSSLQNKARQEQRKTQP